MRRVRAYTAQVFFVAACIFGAIACLLVHATNAIAGKRLL